MTAAAGPGTASVVRLWHLLRWEARVQWRYGIVALVAVVTLTWTGLLAALPQSTARAVAPWILVLDTAVLATTIIGALVILERDQGMRSALQISPARTGECLTSKVGLLAGLVVAGAVPIALAGRPVSLGGLLASLLGVGLVALLTMLLAVAVAAARQNLLTFMIVLPLVLLPLVAPALAHAAGLTHRLMYAVPTVGAMDLIAAGFGGPAHGQAWSAVGLTGAWPSGAWLQAGWLLLACAVAAWLARRQLRGDRAAAIAHRCAEQSVDDTPPAAVSTPARPAAVSTPPRPAARVTAPAADRRRPGAVLAFLRSDLASIRRDPLLLMIGLSPVLLGLGLRFGYPPAHEWLAGSYGFDLDPYRPVLLAVAVVLHVPVVFGMIGAMMVLDDADSRALTALRVTPLTLPRYLGYRLGLVSVAAGLGMAVAVPLSTLTPVGQTWHLIPSLAVAVLVAPLTMLVTLAVAGNKVEGVAMLKLLGLPVYLPVAAWWLNGAAGWLPAPLPTWWVLRSLWDAPGAGYAVAGAALSAIGLAVLTPLALRRLGGGSGAAVEDDVSRSAVGG